MICAAQSVALGRSTAAQKMARPNGPPVSFRVRAEERDALNAAAAERGIFVSTLIRQALRAYGVPMDGDDVRIPFPPTTEAKAA